MSETENSEAVVNFDVLVAAFPTEDGGENALQVLQQAKKTGKVYFEEAAVIRQDAGGGVEYHEPADMSPDEKSGIRGFFGGIVDAFSGESEDDDDDEDDGFDDQSLFELGVGLKLGSSVILLAISSEFLQEARQEISRLDMHEFLISLGKKLSDKLAEGKSVAIEVKVTEDNLITTEAGADNMMVQLMGVGK